MILLLCEFLPKLCLNAVCGSEGGLWNCGNNYQKGDIPVFPCGSWLRRAYRNKVTRLQPYPQLSGSHVLLARFPPFYSVLQAYSIPVIKPTIKELTND